MSKKLIFYNNNVLNWELTKLKSKLKFLTHNLSLIFGQLNQKYISECWYGSQLKISQSTFVMSSVLSLLLGLI